MSGTAPLERASERVASRAGFSDTPLLFACGDDELVGILSRPVGPVHRTGVLVVVGGPQYRAGSHRQFVVLARQLAAHGFATLRFDYRGMGDSTGEARPFDRVDDDIRAAIDALVARVPGLDAIVLWGLCDGASAACLYAPTDARVAGAILVNPWVRTIEGEARTMLRHHYATRLLDRKFWAKLASGRVSIGDALRGVTRATRDAVAGPRGVPDDPSLPERMALGIARSGVPFALALSGRDYVAREFEDRAQAGTWGVLMRSDRCAALEHVPGADHTFSTGASSEAIAKLSLAWIEALSTLHQRRSVT